MELNEKYRPDTAMVGLWFGLNYGSILSAFALYKTVEEMGFKPVFLNKPVGFWDKKFADPDNIAGSFIHKNCYVSPEFYDGDTLFQFTSERKNFIVGSDVLWNYKICGKGAGGFFFLDFVPDYKNKISYASSFGGGFQAPADVTLSTKELLRRIPNRSVGDSKALEIMNLQFDLNAECVLDPLFLTNCFNSLSKKRTDEPYIFTYMENCDSQKRKMIYKAIEIKGCKAVNFTDINNYEAASRKYGMKVEWPVRVEEWVQRIRDAEYVITDSWSAMYMAIIFEKPFLVLAPRQLADISRYYSILDALDLRERLVYVEEDMEDYYYLLRKPVKYTLVNRKLEECRSQSKEWLFNCLNNDVQR